MTDWVSSNYIYSYDVNTGEYAGKLHLRATPTWTQGIAFFEGSLYVTADDGNADRREHDNLWRIPEGTLLGNATYMRHELEFTVPDHLADFGEIEGLDFNKETGEMIVLANRGKQIVLGTPMGLYPGYTKEIHELFVFRIVEETVGGVSEETGEGADKGKATGGEDQGATAGGGDQDPSPEVVNATDTDAEEILDSTAASKFPSFIAMIGVGVGAAAILN